MPIFVEHACGVYRQYITLVNAFHSNHEWQTGEEPLFDRGTFSPFVIPVCVDISIHPNSRHIAFMFDLKRVRRNHVDIE